MLDMIAAQLKVIEIARLKKSCRCCEKMVQEPGAEPPDPRQHGRPACSRSSWSRSSTTTCRSTG
jgi:transposase